LEGSKGHSALRTVKLDIFELREDARSSSDNTAYSNKTVEVGLTELAKGVVHRQVEDTNVDLGVNTLVIGVMEKDDIHGNLVEEFEHLSRGVCQEVSQNGLALGKMLI
jgi:DNA helicase TIP49 (TBP-interacting protein)